MGYNTSSPTEVAQPEKRHEVVVFWCLVSTATAFILAMLHSMPMID